MTDLRNRIFIDTNILVYSYDFSDPAKQKTALESLDTIQKTGRGVLSAQILAEFFTAVTKKIPEPLDLRDAEQQVDLQMQSWHVVDTTPFIVREAIKGVKEHTFSFWDAMIWATAKMNQISVVLSEDFSHNSVIEGVRFLNPFIYDINIFLRV